MGFRTGAYATVWRTRETNSDKVTKAQVSTNRKNRQTGEFERDFSQWVKMIGAANDKVKKLGERARIKILECEALAEYNKEKETTYYEFIIYDFEEVESGTKTPNAAAPEKKQAFPDDPVQGDVNEDNLPF